MTQENLFDASPSQPTALESARRRLAAALETLEDAELAVDSEGTEAVPLLMRARSGLSDARAEVARLEKAEIERRKL